MSGDRPTPTPGEPAWPPPRILRHWQTWLVLMALLLIPFFVPIPVDLRRDVLISALGDRLHIVLLAGVTLLLYWRGPLRGRLAWAAAGGAVIGAAIEFVQELVGRTALFHDFVLDLMGVGMVVGLVLWRGHGRRLGAALLAALIVVALSQFHWVPPTMLAARDSRHRFPVIADFEGDHDLWICRDNYGALLARDPDAAHAGGHGLRITCPPSDKWPGASLRRFPHDWSGYRAVELKIRHGNAGLDSLRIGVRLDDFVGARDKDWLSAPFWVTTEWRTVVLPFAGALTRWSERPFDPTDVDGLTVWTSHPPDTTVIEIDDVVLR